MHKLWRFYKVLLFARLLELLIGNFFAFKARGQQSMALSLNVLWGVIGREKRGNVNVSMFKAAVYLFRKQASLNRKAVVCIGHN